MGGLKGVHYDAFISYRHSEPDGFVAKTLHKKLEGFKLPHALKGKSEGGRDRLSRVFLDEKELSLSGDLSEPIREALENSDYLIAICSPRYVKSRWCMQEIETFLETHDREHVLLVLAEDEPENSFPEILTVEEVEEKDENGQLRTVKKEIEPLAADTRGENIKEIWKNIDTAAVKLCAVMFGLNYDDLKQRHREARMRTFLRVWGLITLAVLLFAFLAVYSLITIRKKNELISRQYAELEDRYASQVAESAESMLRQGRPVNAVKALLEVMPEEADDPYNTDALRALYSALNVYSVNDLYVPVAEYAKNSLWGESAVSSDGRYLAVDGGGSVLVYDTSSRQVVRRIDCEEGFYDFEFCGTDGLVIARDREVVYQSVLSEECRQLCEVQEEVTIMKLSQTDRVIIAKGAEAILMGEDGSVCWRICLDDYMEDTLPMLGNAAYDDQKILLTVNGMEHAYLVLVDETGAQVKVLREFEQRGWLCGNIHNGMVYYAVSSYTDSNNTLTVGAFSPVTGVQLWEKENHGFAANAILVSDQYIYIEGDISSGMVLDCQSGEQTGMFLADAPIMESWLDEEENIWYLSAKGSVYSSDGSYFLEETESFFKDSVDSQIIWASYRNGHLYLSFMGKDYVTEYIRMVSPLAERFETEKGVQYDHETYLSDEELESLGVVKDRMDYAFRSEDERYIVVCSSGQYAEIYDPLNKVCVSRIGLRYALDEAIALRYSQTCNAYILDVLNRSYILTDDMQELVETGRIVDEDGENLIIMSSYEEFYRIPYVDEKELVELAREYLLEHP